MDKCRCVVHWLLLSSLVCALSAADPVYDRISAALADHPHRLPGSPHYNAAVDAVAEVLATAGVETHRLRYGTLVPTTRTCRLVIDGSEISGLLAMAPNGPVPPTTWGRELSGPAVWLGNGTLAEMRGLPVAGAIAFVRLGSSMLPEIFAQGALAVIAVGDDATQWQAAQMFTEAPIASPRAWLPLASAEAAGLTTNPSTPRVAKLNIDVRWKEVEATSLWAFIPAAAGAEHANQTMVLATELATSGAVPELSPGGRAAANVAVLAQLASTLGREPLQRNILVVFLGSHYAAQDGARLLYYVVNAARRGESSRDLLVDRAAAIDAGIARCARRLELLDGDALLSTSGDDPAWLRNQLRRILSARINALNYSVRTLNLTGQGTAQLPLLKSRIEVHNHLRRQVHERQVTDREAFADLSAQLKGELAALRASLIKDRSRVASFRELETALKGQSVIAHLGIDFASASAPWIVWRCTPSPWALSTRSWERGAPTRPDREFCW